MNEYEKNVYKNIFEYPTKKIVELELENENQRKQLEAYKNVIKEAINFVRDKARNNCWIDQYEANDLLNILNKVGGNDEN